MQFVERQTKRGTKTKARPSWTAYGTGSWMTWSRYRKKKKKWSRYFINIAPRWEALKVDRATMSNRWSWCLKPTITVKTGRSHETRPNQHSQFCYLLYEAPKTREREKNRACSLFICHDRKRQTCARKSTIPKFIRFNSFINTLQINTDIRFKVYRYYYSISISKLSQNMRYSSS